MKRTSATQLAPPAGPARRASGSSSRSGQLPEGDVRLTANIRADLHLALKIRAARERTTIGELIETWVETWKDKD
ncbi:hypothetical protein ACFOHU_07625 [Ottowia pentelensis]|uniref:Chromosome partitioning protein ParB n=1 Tax=Ottowia pentelensis TaxID=511108 RepID=A0ABV6PTT9_9BURK